LRLRVWRSPCCRARTASERSLEAVQPFPGLAGAKSTKEENRLPSRSHRSAYRRSAIQYKSHPAPPPNTRRAVCTVKVIFSKVNCRLVLKGRERELPISICSTRHSSKRSDRIFMRQAFTSNQKARSRQNTSRGNAPRTHTRTHRDLPHLSPSPEYHP
jgi:hypothetical protein